MITKKPSKTKEFVEQDEGFIKQLAKDIGCHYYKANERTYNLNRHKSDIRGEMGIFAWVHKEDQDYFWVATRKVWVEEARTKLPLHRNKAGADCFPQDDKQGDSVYFDVRDGYQKTVRALKLINKLH